MAHYARTAQLPDAGFTPDADFPVIYAEKGLCWATFTVTGGQPAGDPLRLVAAEGGSSPNMIPGRCRLTFDGLSGREDVRCDGVLGHASMPWLGRNAISLAMRREADRRLSEAGCQPSLCPLLQWRSETTGMAPAFISPGATRPAR
jgi:acetylornithine deacetylase/succinyl-diaminopimelate desuccinylase-like protein